MPCAHSLDGPSSQLARTLRPEIEKLTTSGLISVRNKASELLHAIEQASEGR